MKKPLKNTTPQLQRMLLSLQKYAIDLLCLAGKENILANTLSRAHLEELSIINGIAFKGGRLVIPEVVR